MSLTPPAITGAILLAGAGIFPGSQMLPKVATAVGNSIPLWLPAPVNVLALGVTAGLAGGGNVQGKMTCIPAGQMAASLLAAGYVGVDAPGLAMAVEIGFGSSFNASAQYQGLSVGVSGGTDVSKIIVANPATLTPILVANLAALSVTGVNAARLALGLSTWILPNPDHRVCIRISTISW